MGRTKSIKHGKHYGFLDWQAVGQRQRFIGSIDDVRLYSVAFSDFEVEMLYGESKGSPLDVGEGNYTISVWAKPTTLSPPVDYDFATAWYEGGEGIGCRSEWGKAWLLWVITTV